MQTQEAPPTEALLDGRYRLLGCIGRGGMASVYRAEDTLLERTVAVKLIRHDPDAQFSADRAQSEKALLASLNHPALVTLFDARLEPGSAQYLVMEFVDGPTLAARLTRGPIPSGELAQIAGDLADALDAVHSAGIIHRDVKPSNVLLTPPKHGTGRWGAKLADFGIACALDSARATTPGVILGTAAYMAPEQLRNEELSPAADIYALGLILLEALTGQPAYPVSTSIEAALVRLSAPPTIPESLGPAWSRMLALMIRTDPAERPTAGEVASAVRAIPAAVGESPDDESPGAGAGIATEPAPATLPPTQVLPITSEPSPLSPPSSPRRRSMFAALATAFVATAAIAAGGWATASAPVDGSRVAGVISAQRTAPQVPAVVEPAQAETDADTARSGDGPDNSGSGNSGSGESERNDDRGKSGSGGEGKKGEDKGKGR